MCSQRSLKLALIARLVEITIVSTKLHGKFAIYYPNPEQCPSGVPVSDEVVGIKFFHWSLT